MAARLYLRCLGAPGLFTAGGAPIRFKVRKHLALLVYLAIEPRARHARDALATLLWPRVAGREARHSLATALTVLRSVLGADVLDASRDFVRLLPGALDLDLDRLAAGDVLAGDDRPALPVAGFLEELEIPDAAEFMLWRDRQRARLLPQVRDALVVQMDRCRRTGNWSGIEPLADTLLRLDELNEDAVRAKMEARAFVGDRISALKLYEGWRAQLYEELGATPAPLLEQLAQRLRRRGIERPLLDLPAVQTARWHDQPFVGRAAEYQQLYECWERMRRGEPGHVLVTGLAGVGKTTLVERFATAVALEGAVVVRVQGHELERELPYAVLAELVRQLLDRPGAAATPPEALAELGRIVPEVRLRYPGLPAPTAPASSVSLAIANSTAELCASIAEEAPLVLIAENIQWTDKESQCVVHLVLRRLGHERVLAVHTGRPSDENRLRTDRSPFSFVRVGAFATVRLDSLSHDESSELALALAKEGGYHLDAFGTEAIARASGGSPLALELLVRNWTEHPHRSLAIAFHAMTAALDCDWQLTSAYDRELDLVLARLPDPAKLTLTAAAVAGRRLTDARIYSALGLADDAVAVSLAQLASCGVLIERDSELAFANLIYRASSYLRTPESLRRRLHMHVAELWDTLDDRPFPSRDLEAAWHLTRAGAFDLAAPKIIAGASQASFAGLHFEAELALASSSRSLTGQHRRDAIALLVRLQQDAARWTDSMNTLSLVPADDRTAVQASQQIRARASQGELVGPHLLSQTSQLVGHARSASTVRDAAEHLAALAAVAGELQLNDSLLEFTDPAASTECAEDREWTEAALARAQVMFFAGYRKECRALLDQVNERIAGRTVSPRIRCRVLSGYAALAGAGGDYESADAQALAALSLAQSGGSASQVVACVTNRVLFLNALGDYEQVVRILKSQFSTRLPRRPDESLLMLGTLAKANAMLGDYLAARACSENVLAQREAAAPSWRRDRAVLSAADALWISGDQGKALDSATTALQESSSAGALHTVGPRARWSARLIVAENRGSADVLERAGMALERMERIDRLETLGAQQLLWEAGVTRTAVPIERLLDDARSLPRATVHALARLGAIPATLAALL